MPLLLASLLGHLKLLEMEIDSITRMTMLPLGSSQPASVQKSRRHHFHESSVTLQTTSRESSPTLSWPTKVVFHALDCHRLT